MPRKTAASAEAFNVRTFGAVGDGVSKDTDAIRAALAACADAGGGVLRFPAGTYLTGPIELGSRMTLLIEAGATLLGSPDANDYPRVKTRYEGVIRELPQPLVFAHDAENVTICGLGTIDGNGRHWWDRFREWITGMQQYDAKGVRNLTAAEKQHYDELHAKNAQGRPRLVALVECQRVLIDGVTLQNSAAWTLHPTFCDNVTINNVRVLNPPRSPNTDGINPDSCRNVRISNCHIDVGDDCITIKSGLDEEGRRIGRPCEQIVITNCTMVHGHGGVVIGSEMSGGVRDVAISNCVFHQTHVGFRMKTKRGRGNVVENISVNNIVMSEVRDAIHITMHYACGGLMDAEPVSERTPTFRDVAISNVMARDCDAAGLCEGLPERFIDGITFSNVRIRAKRGFVCRDARNVTFSNSHIHAEEGAALTCENVENLTLLDSFRDCAGDESAMRFSNLRGLYARGPGWRPDASNSEDGLCAASSAC